MSDKKISYFMKPGKERGTVAVYSIVDTDFGGPAENWIWEGEVEEADLIMRMLYAQANNSKDNGEI